VVDTVRWDDPAAVEHLVQDVEHEAIAAQHHDRVGFFRGHPGVGGGKYFAGLLRTIAVRDGEGQAHVLGHEFCSARPSL
jgi:hypothetical protein